MPTALFVSPFSASHNHHGYRRLARFSRWLARSGWTCQLLTACSQTSEEFDCVSVASDPFRLWTCEPPGPHREPARRNGRPVRSWRSGLGKFCIPDPTMGWALRVMLSPVAHRLASRCDALVSSSPPESPHIATALLAAFYRKPFVMDMRDGWIDEPIRNEIASSLLRRTLESALETWAINRASAVLVTSNEWREALCTRHPALRKQVVVVTNVVPTQPAPPVPRVGNSARRWVYVGRFSGSHSARHPHALLSILEHEATIASSPIDFRFIGQLSVTEQEALDGFRQRVAPYGCSVTATGHTDHAIAQAEICAADVLLLVSASQCAIPAKLFEYLAGGAPILAICRRNSATWNICQGVQRATCVDPDDLASSSDRYRPPTPGSNALESPLPDDLSVACVSERLVSTMQSLAIRAPRP